MSNAVRKSDEHSLIIIDEFGKGTMTEVGLSLLAACLNWWLEGPREKCPHIFVASHFYALRTLLIDSDMLRFQTMDVERNADDSLEFKFKLVDGIIDMSYATLTALKMGIPRDVVDRSEEVFLHLRVGGSIVELVPQITQPTQVPDSDPTQGIQTQASSLLIGTQDNDENKSTAVLYYCNYTQTQNSAIVDENENNSNSNE